MTDDEPYQKAPDFLTEIREGQAARRAGKQVVEMLPVHGVSKAAPDEIDEQSTASVIQLADSRRRFSRSGVIAGPKKPPGK